MKIDFYLSTFQYYYYFYIEKRGKGQIKGWMVIHEKVKNCNYVYCSITGC